MNFTRLVFLKLGGSLITEKTSPMTVRPEIIHQLADEIASAVQADPGLRLLIGHGSGSFGHTIANQYQTQSGGDGKAYWRGFTEVWKAARELNQIIITALTRVNLPVIAFPPSAGVISQDIHIKSWDIRPIQRALNHDLIPVVQGDVIFDDSMGGTILSTEVIFHYLAKQLNPHKILLAGLDEGVYRVINGSKKIIPLITPNNIEHVMPVLSTSEAVDVTGGMVAKVRSMLSLVEENPFITIQIFSGFEPGQTNKALTGKSAPFGTVIAKGDLH